MALTVASLRGLLRAAGSGGGSVTNANAQLVLNKTKKTGFTFFIRLL